MNGTGFQFCKISDAINIPFPTKAPERRSFAEMNMFLSSLSKDPSVPYFFEDLFQLVEEKHKNKLVHGQICLENIFIEKGVLHLLDFQATQKNYIYSPPEMLTSDVLKETVCTEAADMFAVGMVLLAYYHSQFFTVMLDSLRSGNKSEFLQFHKQCLSMLERSVQVTGNSIDCLLSQLLAENPQERLTVSDARSQYSLSII